MSVFDVSKKVIPIDIFFTEETQVNGMSKFHFIHSQEEFDEWKEKGYRTQDEMSEIQRRQVPRLANKVTQEREVDEAKVIKSVRTEWKRLSWKDQNTIFSKAIKHVTLADGQTSTHLDPIIYRDLKLKLCLKKWNLSDEQGREIPVTEAAIDSLLPEFASELISSFERKTGDEQ